MPCILRVWQPLRPNSLVSPGNVGISSSRYCPKKVRPGKPSATSWQNFPTNKFQKKWKRKGDYASILLIGFRGKPDIYQKRGVFWLKSSSGGPVELHPYISNYRANYFKTHKNPSNPLNQRGLSPHRWTIVVDLLHFGSLWLNYVARLEPPAQFRDSRISYYPWWRNLFWLLLEFQDRLKPLKKNAKVRPEDMISLRCIS